jgi:hypothetical protein
LSLIAAYMRTNCPQLFPWIAWNQVFGASGADLYQMGIPTSADETYPFGGSGSCGCANMTADSIAGYYCQKYFGDSQSLQSSGCPYWPLINYGPSDSLLRFPAYAAVAYGAKGIWYYTYNAAGGGCHLSDLGGWTNAVDVSNHLTSNYFVAQDVNRHIASWSSWLLGRSSPGLFGAMRPSQGPFIPDPNACGTYPVQNDNGLAAPASYKLVQSASDHVVIGILTKPGAFPLAMVVNGLTSTIFGDTNFPARSLTIQFAPQVTAIDVIQSGTNIKQSNGNSITLTLEAGGGQLLQLEGSQLDVLTDSSAIYASSAPLAFTPTGYWRMGENDPGATAGLTSTTLTDSTGSNNLAVSGEATYAADVSMSAQAHVGSALSVNFSGSGGYATGNLVSTAQDNFGVEAWVKPTSVTRDQTIVYNGVTGGAGASGWGLRINGTNSTYSALFGGVTFIPPVGSSPATPNVWTHLALVRDNGVATFYVNGIAAETTTYPPNLPSGNFAIGAPPQNPSNQPFIGSVDEVRVFTFPAGQFTVSDLLLNQSPAFREVGYWRMGEEDPNADVGAAAETTKDSAGTNDLACFGEPFYSDDVSSAAATHAESSLSLGFSGLGAYAIGGLASAAQDNFGLEAWVKPAVVNADQTIAYNGDTSASGWGLRIAGDNSTYCALFGGVTFFGSSPAAPNVWTHLALVRNNGLSTLYVNGMPVAETNAVPNVPAGNFAVGEPPGSTNQFFTGEIDEVRIFTFPPDGFSTNDLLLYQSATPTLFGLKLLTNGAFQFASSNAINASWTVLSSTNLSLPFVNWTPIGTASNIAPGLFQFTSVPGTNEREQFYIVRSP